MKTSAYSALDTYLAENYHEVSLSTIAHNKLGQRKGISQSLSKVQTDSTVYPNSNPRHLSIEAKESSSRMTSLSPHHIKHEVLPMQNSVSVSDDGIAQFVGRIQHEHRLRQLKLKQVIGLLDTDFKLDMMVGNSADDFELFASIDESNGDDNDILDLSMLLGIQNDDDSPIPPPPPPPLTASAWKSSGPILNSRIISNVNAVPLLDNQNEYLLRRKKRILAFTRNFKLQFGIKSDSNSLLAKTSIPSSMSTLELHSSSSGTLVASAGENRNTNISVSAIMSPKPKSFKQPPLSNEERVCKTNPDTQTMLNDEFLLGANDIAAPVMPKKDVLSMETATFSRLHRYIDDKIDSFADNLHTRLSQSNKQMDWSASVQLPEALLFSDENADKYGSYQGTAKISSTSTADASFPPSIAHPELEPVLEPKPEVKSPPAVVELTNNNSNNNNNNSLNDKANCPRQPSSRTLLMRKYREELSSLQHSLDTVTQLSTAQVVHMLAGDRIPTEEEEVNHDAGVLHVPLVSSPASVARKLPTTTTIPTANVTGTSRVSRQAIAGVSADVDADSTPGSVNGYGGLEFAISESRGFSALPPRRNIPATVLASIPASVLAPIPATVLAPIPASVLAPIAVAGTQEVRNNSTTKSQKSQSNLSVDISNRDDTKEKRSLRGPGRATDMDDDEFTHLLLDIDQATSTATDIGMGIGFRHRHSYHNSHTNAIKRYQEELDLIDSSSTGSWPSDIDNVIMSEPIPGELKDDHLEMTDDLVWLLTGDSLSLPSWNLQESEIVMS